MAVLLAAILLPAPAWGADVYKASLDPAIPHHAAILDKLSAIEKDPSNAQLHNDLGCLVAWDGFWRDALRSFDTAAKLAPKDARPHFNAGLVHALRGEWRSARSRFRKTVNLDPGNWPAWWMIGLAEETLGNQGSAVDAYSRSVRVDTSLFEPRVNPFAVATRLKSRVLLATYETRRVDAALPLSNQLGDPSRVASFFQAHPKAADTTPAVETATKTGPVVTSVPPPSSTVVRPTTPPAVEPTTRRRRAYAGSLSRQREGQLEVADEPARQEPDEVPDASEEKKPAPTPAAPGLQPATPAPAAGPSPGVGGSPRRYPVPATTRPPDPE